MVLWEITLGTAYFLGLKKTYKLALRLQRRLIGPNHPKIQQFVHRRVRAVFDMAVKVHKNVQQRDLEVGRNFGNWILRWLDRMKPSAQIRALPPGELPSAGIKTKHMTKSSTTRPAGNIKNSDSKIPNSKSDGRVFTSSMNLKPKFPTFMRMMEPVNPTSTSTQYRRLSISGPEMPRLNYSLSRHEGVIRKDIMQWMARN